MSTSASKIESYLIVFFLIRESRKQQVGLAPALSIIIDSTSGRSQAAEDGRHKLSI